MGTDRQPGAGLLVLRHYRKNLYPGLRGGNGACRITAEGLVRRVCSPTKASTLGILLVRTAKPSYQNCVPGWPFRDLAPLGLPPRAREHQDHYEHLITWSTYTALTY